MYLRSETEELKMATQTYGSVVSVWNVYREEKVENACVISEDEKNFKANLKGLALQETLSEGVGSELFLLDLSAKILMLMLFRKHTQAWPLSAVHSVLSYSIASTVVVSAVRGFILACSLCICLWTCGLWISLIPFWTHLKYLPLKPLWQQIPGHYCCIKSTFFFLS